MPPQDSRTHFSMNAALDPSTNTSLPAEISSLSQKAALPSPLRVYKHPNHCDFVFFSWRAMLASFAHVVTPSPCHLVTLSPRHVVIALLALTAAAHAGAPSDLAQLDFFEKKIRPVLVESCY